MHSPPTDWNERYVKGETPWDSNRPSRELARLVEGGILAPCRVLELGCGTGTNAVYLAQRGFDVTAADVSPLAIEKAKEKARAAGVNVQFHAANALSFDFGPPFPLVFDRGVYHALRLANLFGFLKTLERTSQPGGLYVTLAGNANEPEDPEGGPPRVHAHELCFELAPLFDLVELREFRFDAVDSIGGEFRPLGWSVVLRRKGA